MSAKPINDGGPAFPGIVSNRRAPDLPNGHQVGNFEFQMYGMTLRDYFASKAMHQFLHGAVLPVGYDATKELRLLADRAYEMADAMLKAREA